MTQLVAAFRMAMRAITSSRLRAGLTALGILIGICALVLVVALGTGVKQRIVKEMDTLGANTIYVWSQATQRSGAKQRVPNRLTDADVAAVKREATSVIEAAPFSDGAGQVISEYANAQTMLVGTNGNYWSVRGFDFALGRSFSRAEEQTKARVCVIGETVRNKLFGGMDPIGKTVRIGRHPYQIVGLLKKKGQSPFGEDQDDRVVMPIGTFRARVVPTSPGRIQMLMASASSPTTVERATTQIDRILRARRGLSDDAPADFVIRTQAEFRKTQQAIVSMLSMLLFGLALISLTIGGIGIMNIMLVSVSQRTREIGIRLAVGAARSNIIFQFVIEALTLSLVGGILGLALGTALSFLLSDLLGWSLVVPWTAALLATGLSAGLGVIFGYFPARRAAYLDPIETLRHEG